MIGNSMVLSILFLNRFTAEVETHRDETELILSLGGTRNKPFIDNYSVNQSKYDSDNRESKNNRSRPIARNDEWTNHCWCRPGTSSSIPIADHLPITNDCRSDKRPTRLFILSKSIQSAHATVAGKTIIYFYTCFIFHNMIELDKLIFSNNFIFYSYQERRRDWP